MHLSGVRLSVCLSHPAVARRCCCGFAAVGPANKRYRSTAAQPVACAGKYHFGGTRTGTYAEHVLAREAVRQTSVCEPNNAVLLMLAVAFPRCSGIYISVRSST